MRKAFTLVELLITIAIIGILASIGLYTYPNIQKMARDSRRKSDLKQYQTLLENYANKSDGLYLIYTSTYAIPTVGGTFCATLGLTNGCIFDPKYPPSTYKYISDNTGTKYVLWATLESKIPTAYWVLCSNGKNGETTTNPSPVGGSCPI